MGTLQVVSSLHPSMHIHNLEILKFIYSWCVTLYVTDITRNVTITNSVEKSSLSDIMCKMNDHLLLLQIVIQIVINLEFTLSENKLTSII